jgi:transcriptional antiterminator
MQHIGFNCSIYFPKDELLNYVKQGLTGKEISEIFKVSTTTIRKRIKGYNTNIPRAHIRYKLNIPYTQLVEEYNSGISVPELSIKYRVSTNYIKTRMRENGGVFRTKKEAQLLRYKRAALNKV